MFIGANRSSYPLRGQLSTQLLHIVNNSGDVSYLPREHGSPRNHGYWGRRGLGTRNLAACNTFTAPSARVS